MQIREDPDTQKEELNEFVRFSELNESQFTVLNTFDTPVFKPEIANDFDAVFVGGSSDATVREPEKYSFVHSIASLLKLCYEKDIPVLASCFGFQVAAEFMGGKVILDKANMEMGTFDIELTEAAKDDLLLHDTPQTFVAVCGHKERAESLPNDTTVLAYSKACPFHAFKFNGKRFYGFQFHPEVDAPDLVTRITRYEKRYFDGNHELEEMKNSIRPTPESNEIIKKFVDRILI